MSSSFHSRSYPLSGLMLLYMLWCCCWFFCVFLLVCMCIVSGCSVDILVLNIVNIVGTEYSMHS